MTIDKEKLKALAWHTEDHLADKSATTYDAEVAARWAEKGWPLYPLFDQEQVDVLLAEIEGLHAQHGRDSGELRKLCSARDSARRQRDQLKSENEALRNDAERYRWMRQRHIPLEGHDFLSTQEILDRRIDAAMLKEQPQ